MQTNNPQGEQDLHTLLQHMTPTMQSGTYVFTTFDHSEEIPQHLAICQIKEEEGTTIIMSKENADTLDIPYTFVSSWITLNIHSSLNAVGLTAEVAKTLARHNISCNVVAGYYHDHLFVYEKDGNTALKLLNELTHSSTQLPIDQSIAQLFETKDKISDERKQLLNGLAQVINQQRNDRGFSKVTFICTHNSRRSQLAQIWLWKALSYQDIKGISSYSAGTEATAFNIRMVKAVQRFGFEIQALDQSQNPKYVVRDGVASELELILFSKKIENDANPQSDFIAVMVCDQADHDCPFVAGADYRFSLPYTDPKSSDDQPDEEKRYNDKVIEIGREILYLSSMIK